jgi:hypothetical protein
MRNIYISPEAAKTLPTQCQVMHVTPLLRELILEMVKFEILYEK